VNARIGAASVGDRAISAKRGRGWSEQDLFALLSLFAQRASVEMSEDDRRDDD
jgi:hypothetical protein